MDGRFAGFRVAKQGDSDSACGLYCVLSAAQHVFRDDYDAHKAAVLRRIARSTALSKAMFGSGVLPAHFRALAEAAGFAMWRPRNAGIATLADLTEEAIWVVQLRMRFQRGAAAASGDAVIPKASERGDRHYVVVLRISRRHVTIADPHPWHEDVFELERKMFMTSWRSARDKGGSLWAARLSATSRPVRAATRSDRPRSS
jgi:hypothetical protein